jgi:hypothetical protein
LEKNSHDGPSGVYMERCEEFLRTPAAADDWDGVYEMKTK